MTISATRQSKASRHTSTTVSAINADDDVLADFALAARRFPHHTAIVHDGDVITYEELAQRVSSSALRYRRRLAADDSSRFIGALVSHTPAVAEHMLAILQAGATYCPIDDALPTARKQAIGAALGLDRLYATTADPRAANNVRIETLDDATELAAEMLPLPSWHEGDPAYVLCTSGSTGKPKPVVVSRRALATTVRALRHLFALSSCERVLQFASLGWDTCLEEILPALTSGAALVFDEEAQSGSLPRFVRMLARREVTVLDLPTAFWHELVLYLDEEHTTLPDNVRLVIIGGERIDATRLRQWRHLDAGRMRLLNTYGCTETTMITHAVQLAGAGTEPEIEADDAEAPIGRPLPHVQDHVTDEDELLISGPILATEYLGLSELTEHGFPVSDRGSGPIRWFHTGDLVARGAGGLLYSRGRADEQVKVLGVRVHPAEVETQLNAHPSVTSAVVLGERRLGRTSLTAYVVAAGAITSAELKCYLRERLPSQFVPSQVKFVDSLAYTATGKVDRLAIQQSAAHYDDQGASR